MKEDELAGGSSPIEYLLIGDRLAGRPCTSGVSIGILLVPPASRSGVTRLVRVRAGAEPEIRAGPPVVQIMPRLESGTCKIRHLVRAIAVGGEPFARLFEHRRLLVLTHRNELCRTP